MPTVSRRPQPVRSLVVFAILVATVFGIVAGGHFFDENTPASWTPNLALDLEGGTQIILTPAAEEGEDVPVESVDQAAEIIRQRVNGSGVTEAEVTRQGDSNILVALPGQADEATRDLVRQSAELTFRPVLLSGAGFALPDPTATSDQVGPLLPQPQPSAEPDADAGVAPEEATEPSAPATNGRAVPRLSGTPAGDAAAGTAEATEPVTEPVTEPTAVPVEPAPAPTDASDPAYLSPEVLAAFEALDCTAEGVLSGTSAAPEDQPLVTCSEDGTEKYVLGPVELQGTAIADAAFGLGQSSTGASTGQWVVNIDFTSDGGRQFADVTQRLAANTGDRNRFAVVLDGLVVSAPTTTYIPGGQAEISGNFTQESAEALSNQLKFGALPLSFVVETEASISPTLGSESLRWGLLAGLVGLGLVVVYSLIQYRALGLVTVASLLVAGILVYGLLLILSWRQGYRLSLPGIAGLIVAIGITVDSFIVFFERVRDEIRDGRSLSVAVENGWGRAQRTILASDTVSFLAAVVLYLLAVGGVRGFAFTLGLTTVVDLIVVFLFTKPLVTLLARTKFFGGGGKLSGFDAEHLGSVVARRAVRSSGRTTLAERKRVASGATAIQEGGA